ncbi:MAG: T9SS type A sorting domain-containing protein [Bacteroidales bacterium]|nr:T9SS type A sorting domain-containing protein [Bacteroidales bacterium]
MKKNLLSLLLLVFYAVSFSQDKAPELFISEYCEYNHTVSNPQIFNHYIKIYNGTGDSVDLSKYQLWRSFNANGWNNNAGTPVTPVNLNGKLAHGQTYVITRPNTESNPITIEPYSSQTCTYLNISGDDAIALAKDDGSGNYIIIDIIGSPTMDPGDYWSVAGVANGTQNATIVRKPTVCGPNTNWELSAGSNADDSEWIVKTQNDISDIGKHLCECAGIVVEEPVEYTYDTVTALFLGNSYTYYFDLPVIIDMLAGSTGDKLIHYQNTPGGHSLEGHFSNAASLSALKARFYDYVVLQDQSQRPALAIETVERQTFKYASLLDSIRRIYSPCGQTMFYMTWGRKNGDANNCGSLPDVCTYNGMDSLLNLRYQMMRDQNEALISPVGAVWHYIRDNFPSIELYDADASHPSAAGSYAAACCFYSVLFKKDPAKCTYNFSIDSNNAKIIREAAKLIVFDSLQNWNNYKIYNTDSVDISILSPVDTNKFTESEVFTARVEAAATIGAITEVSFFLNGELKHTDTEAPFETEMSSTFVGANNIIVTATNSEGYVNAARVNFTVKKAPVVNSVDDTGVIDFISYPNPADKILYINIENAMDGAEIRIFDFSGRTLIRQDAGKGNNAVNIGHLKSGMYTIQIVSGNSITTQVFIRN